METLQSNSFYGLLQLGPQQMKQIIKQAPKEEKKKYIFNMIIRNLLVVLFAIIFVGGASSIFGKNNTSVAVAFFCILLQGRYVNYGYNIKTSIINLGIMSMIFAIDSQIAPNLPSFLAFIVNFSLLGIIIVMTCNNPRLGNIAVYVDSYLFTTFMGPQTTHELKLRFIEVVIGFVICAYSFYKHNKNKDQSTTFSSTIKIFDFKNTIAQWQFKLMFGLSLGLFVGEIFHLPRYFWIAIAGLSVLAPFGEFSIKKRIVGRTFGIIMGCLFFYLLVLILPAKYLFLVGPLGGFLVGFTTTYHWSSAFNCFGALSLAASIYGANFALGLRIFNNLLGCILSTIFVIIYLWLLKKSKLSTSKM